MEWHQMLLLGDPSVGKTLSLKEFIGDNFDQSIQYQSNVSLYNTVVALDDATINCTFWEVSRLPIESAFITNVSTVIIFCNLQNTQSCDRLETWDELGQKYCTGDPIIVGTTYKSETTNNNVIEKNKVKVLHWCVQRGDIPFFCIDLHDPQMSQEMYHTIISHRLTLFC